MGDRILLPRLPYQQPRGKKPSEDPAPVAGDGQEGYKPGSNVASSRPRLLCSSDAKEGCSGSAYFWT